jgi:mRNA interferase MazF
MGKQRPALVIADTGDADVLLARITTQLHSDAFDVKVNDWKISGLLAPSVVRLHKLATIEKRLISRQMGTLTPSDRHAVAAAIRSLLAGW